MMPGTRTFIGTFVVGPLPEIRRMNGFAARIFLKIFLKIFSEIFLKIFLKMDRFLLLTETLLPNAETSLGLGLGGFFFERRRTRDRYDFSLRFWRYRRRFLLLFLGRWDRIWIWMMFQNGPW